VARHHARELALRVLFEHDVARTALDEVINRGLNTVPETDRAFARTLVEGTVAELGTWDEWIGESARDWRVSRMAAIDRNILRLACYELAHEADVPLSVIIDEALELAQQYSTEDAKRFVNGVLGAIAGKVRPEGDTDRREHMDSRD